MYIKFVFYQFTINLFRCTKTVLYDLVEDIKQHYGIVNASKISTLQVGYSVPKLYSSKSM